MSCYSPIQAFRTPSGVVFSALSRHDILGSIELPCGMCIGCRMRRASDWALRCTHEAQMWPDNCFLTLTYARDQMPAHGSLDHRDFQLFMKRVRKAHTGQTIRFFMCGEYGPLTHRPHYHACLFNVNWRTDRIPQGQSKSGFLFYASKTLDDLWRLGRVTVQDFTAQAAGYTARYIMKKALGQNAETAYQKIDPETGEIVQLKPEYCAMSLKPDGIGAAWFRKYGTTDVFPQDFVVADGSKHPVPRYYTTLLRDSGNVQMDEVEFARQQKAREARADQTDERRKVREAVHIARVKTLTRGDI